MALRPFTVFYALPGEQPTEPTADRNWQQTLDPIEATTEAKAIEQFRDAHPATKAKQNEGARFFALANFDPIMDHVELVRKHSLQRVSKIPTERQPDQTELPT
jgi:hypothetical protein